MKKDKNFYALVLAGGLGSRFWPASKESLPKQFIDLTGSGKTLIQETFIRIQKIIQIENIFISTNEKYKELVLKQIPEINSKNLICEQVKRNTAPSILYACLKISQINKKSKVIVLPSDHYIEKLNEFYKNVEHAFTVSKSDRLVTFGINPKFPSTNYGYIKVKNTRESFQKVLRFTEKPGRKLAEKFLRSNMYFWNSGIFIWSTESILNAFKIFEPDLIKTFKSNLRNFDSDEEMHFFKIIFPKIKSLSI
ncbi:MAG: mannose-1-phosphate guanylyltransferase, partial [Flavobacteriales bacterium TMED96]